MNTNQKESVIKSTKEFVIMVRLRKTALKVVYLIVGGLFAIYAAQSGKADMGMLVFLVIFAVVFLSD